MTAQPDDRGSLARRWTLDVLRRLAPLDLNEHRASLKSALQDLQDALLRCERGTATRRITQIAAKLGTTSAITSAMFGTAALFGTASTGTAIGALSGAAFTAAALAWLGGSVAAGSALVFIVPLAGGIAAYVGSKRAWRRFWSGRPRAESDLDSQELSIRRGLDAVLVALEKDGDDAHLSQLAYFTLWTRTVSPVIDEVEARLHGEYRDWPPGSRRRVRHAVRSLRRLRRNATGQLLKSASIPLGVFGSTVMELMSDDPTLSPHQDQILKAFRRFNNELESASTEEIGRYLQDMSNESRQGVLRAVKGIYHEIAVVDQENADADSWKAELVMSANQPGVDIIKTNTETGEIVEVQLKSVSGIERIREAQRRFEDVPVEATSEAAARAGVESTGFSNEGLGQDTSEYSEFAMRRASSIALAEDSLEAGFNAAFITLALSIGGAVLSGQPAAIPSEETARRAASAFTWATGTAVLAELFT